MFILMLIKACTQGAAFIINNNSNLNINNNINVDKSMHLWHGCISTGGRGKKLRSQTYQTLQRKVASAPQYFRLPISALFRVYTNSIYMCMQTHTHAHPTSVKHPFQHLEILLNKNTNDYNGLFKIGQWPPRETLNFSWLFL